MEIGSRGGHGSRALITAASPAQAQRLAVEDASGDTLDPGLDITNVTFHNRDRAVVDVET